MAGKSIINELYQRLRTAAPIYKTQADDAEGFLCTLTLPAVDCSELEGHLSALGTDLHFTGRGCSKKEAEHAAAIAAVELLTAEKVLRPDVPAGSHSRGTATASTSISSATSGVSLPGVGSKRTQSNTDLLDEENSAESLELRILEALTAAYPKPLNGAQLAKLCGHFKLKSKVNHLLYMKLKGQGLVELLDTPTPAWRAAGKALAAAQVAAAGAADLAQGPGSAAAAAAAAGAGPDAACSKGPTLSVSGPSAAGAAGAASAAVTSSRTNSTAAPPAGEDAAGGEVSSAAAAHPHLMAGPAAAATATRGAGMGMGSQRHRHSLQGSPRAAAAVQPTSRAASKGAAMSPAGSSSGVLGARPAVSGGGGRGSCSPVPAAVCGRRQAQQQSGVLQSSVVHSSRGAGVAAPSGTAARHLQQQQKEGGMLYVRLRSDAPRSPGCNLQAAAAAAASRCPEHPGLLQHPQPLQRQHQQQQRPAAPTHAAGVDALLLPQTLAAVAGLGLLDHAEAAHAPRAAAAVAAAGGGPGLGLGSPRQVQPGGLLGVKRTQRPGSSLGAGGLSQGSQEQHSPGPTPGYGILGGRQQQRASPAALQQAAAAAAAGAAAPDGPLQGCRQGAAASDSDEEISPAVLAAASEAASLEPAPFDEQRPGSTGSFLQASSQQQPQQQQGQPNPQQQQRWSGGGGLVQQQQQHLLGQQVDLLAAMHINEQPLPQRSSQQPVLQQQEGPCAHDAVVPQSLMARGRGGGGSSRAPGEAGTKRKYPAYLSTEEEAGAVAGQDTPAQAMDTTTAALAAAALQQSSWGAAGVAASQAHFDQQQQEQHGDQQQQQQLAGPDSDQLHPQRRRRRSGQGGGFSGRGLGSLAAAGDCAAGGARDSRLRGGEGAAREEHTGSSDDMQDWEEGAAAGEGQEAAGAQGGQEQQPIGQHPLQPMAQLQQQHQQQHQQDHHQQQQQQPQQQQPQLGGEQFWPASMWQPDSPWHDQGPTGSSGNPWQWQGQQQAWQPGRQGLGAAVAADSEGNGSCLSLPAAAGAAGGATSRVTAAKQQLRQQPAQCAGAVRQQGQHVSAVEGAADAAVLTAGARPTSPGPCMSGLSVGASAVSGGNRGPSAEPLQAAAAAAAGEVTQPNPQARAVQASQQRQHHQQQQHPAADWLQSEEQALQLLSRLALPPAGPHTAPAAPEAGAGHGAAPGSLVGAPGAAGSCLTVAMAAAAAAAQAAAAVASAAGLVAAEPQAAAPPGTCASGPCQPQAQAADLPAGQSGLHSAGREAREASQAGAVREPGAGSIAAGDACPGPAAAAGVSPAAGGGDGGQPASGIAPAELQAEYERRVGAVRDLVQQLNEALQGLTSIQEQVVRPGTGIQGQQQQQQQQP